jgi:hypothetical protein
MKVPISEVDANLVANHRDVRLFQYLVEATQNEFQTDIYNASLIVKQRVRQINAQSRPIEDHTLLGLENLMRSSAPLVGRKLVFFVSDGFVVDLKKSGAPDILRRVINEAARVGAVVYTLDSRAAFSDPAVDATRNGYLDFSSRQGGRLLAESKMPHEVLETLADDTGGRSLLNSNYFNEALSQAIQETSDYYLLDWRPDSDSQRTGKVKLDVVIKGRPDLRVRVRRHIFNLKEATGEDTAKKPASTNPEEELRLTLGSLYPRRDLPTAVSAGFVKPPDGKPVLNVAMQLNGSALNFEATEQKPEGRKESEVDVLGIALDDRGSFATFKQKLNVTRDAVLSKADRSVQWNQSLSLPPGLYQVRVAIRERDTGRLGSAMQWVEIPKLEATSLAMSSIFVGSRKEDETSGSQKVAIKVDRHFVRDSRLRFLTYVYNMPREIGTSDVLFEVKIFRGDRQVLNLPSEQFAANRTTDPTSLLLSGEFKIEQLTPGQYTLQISASGKANKMSASQQVQFIVE